jgi:hypothetical protein
LTLVPVRVTPARAREENRPNGELSNVMVFSVPRAAAAASKLAAAATEFGAVAREPAPSSAPVNKVSPACARVLTRANAAMASIALLVANFVPFIA